MRGVPYGPRKTAIRTMLPIVARSVRKAHRTYPRQAGSGPCGRLSSKTSVEGPVAPGIRTVPLCEALGVPPPGWTGASRPTIPEPEQSTRARPGGSAHSRTFSILPKSASQLSWPQSLSRKSPPGCTPLRTRVSAEISSGSWRSLGVERRISEAWLSGSWWSLGVERNRLFHRL
jgi:hypothetical protein